ncbi:T9SS type A sorting domain-containing protein [Xanthomarina spongicola]|uniref:Putative secreted protein (Por secretion system target) n=1 Tax=Xanthomarina spongicola TaxID=570520 RepID=A0A316DIJ7_9FLAO|nr:T9SS type A sorting domain-containing protein [Xanthomarina spongicola]PWK18001.1 putative secreted protein (Por secretion system target) [Xanthomarina spongicola]
MKKIYLLLFAISLSFISFSQSPIVTIDRANGPGPTATGNAVSISSIGLTRGIGVNERAGTDFSSRDWNATTQATAVTNNDYMEWSVTGNTNFNAEVTEIDIRLRRNPNGPANWQLFYSTDNFATAGIAVNSVETLAADTNVVYNYNSLSINSGASGTITFRLYAWNATTNGGWLRVRRLASWSGFGIALPGIRLTGNITATSSNDDESNIISSVAFDPSDNIDYQLYSAASGLTTANSLKIGEFTIQDGGNDLTDADALSTILTDLEFDVVGEANFAALALFDGVTNVAEVASVGETTLFSGINGGTGLIAPDNGIKTFDVYATFSSTVTDNEQIQLTISSAIPDGVNGSTFAASDAGGAATLVVGDDNRIEVTATQLVFDQQPTDVNQLEVMTPYPTVNAVDNNTNLDLDYTGVVNVISSGFMNPPSILYNITNGVATLDTIMFLQEGTNVALFAISSPLTAAVSTTFDILGPLVQIAIQDFDSPSPEWNYTNDIPFFDNGWGTDGYYGVIDILAASPIDYTYFSNNVLGENDLNDEGDNGTTGWATILFDDVDISSFTNVQVRFDWQVIGYANNNDNAQYQLFYDGVGQGRVFLFDGDNANPIQDDEGSMVLSIPDSVDEVALEIRIRSNGNNGYSAFDNFKVVSVFDGLVYTNNAWSPYPPSGSTGLENAFVKDGNYIVGSNVEINNLFVENGATVSVASGQSMTVNSDLINGGDLELNSVSTSYSSLIIEGKSTGNVTYNRHVNTNAAVGGNDLISAPVTGQTFGDFASNNPNIYSNPSNTTDKLFGPFDKTTDTYITYDTAIPAEASVVLEPAVGYRAASTDGDTFNFVGIVNTQNVDINIVDSGPTNPEWNLIGNPYPSYLKLSTFLATNSTVFDPASSGIYGYDGDASDGYNIWNQAYSDMHPNAAITPGQGFLIASASGGATVSFTTVMRTIGTTDDFIPGRISSIEHLQLELSSSDQVYKTDFYFTDNATLGLDPGYDSRILGESAPSFSIYSHLVEENNGHDIAVQSLGYTDFADVTIPLGINATQGEELTISIFDTSLPESTNVYLEDSVANTVTLLNESEYTFTTSTNLNGIGRFFLRFSESSLSTEELAFNSLHVFATVTPKAIFIKGNLTDTTLVKVFDMQGRLVLTSTLESGSTRNQIDVSTLATGIYAVSVSNKSLTKTQKVIIK